MARLPIAAHIGMHVPPTDDDCTRYACALEAAGRYWPAHCSIHVINLEYQHDFLTMRNKYDAVLIHSIFHTNDGFLEFAKRVFPVSPVHSINRWVRRLSTCGAKVIVVYEGIPFALNGWQLGHLPGYRTYIRDHVLTVYVKRRSIKVK